MKHLLFGTTALVAAGLLATPAFADDAKKEQPIQITIGGYIYEFFSVTQQHQQTGQSTVGAANAVSASNRNNKVIKDKSRIQFDGRTQLDNGLVAGLRVQLRGVTGDSNISTSQSEDQIDEHFAFLDSATYGRMEAGSTASAPRKMWYGAVTPAMPVHGFMSPNFVETQGGAQQPTTLITMGGQTDRAEKVQYFTPRIVGFQLGGSYAPDSCIEGESNLPLGGNAPNVTGVNTVAGAASCHFNGPNALNNQPGVQKNIWSGAVNYVNKFGDFDLGIYAGFETADIGAQTGFGVFAGTVGPLKTSRTQAGTGFRVSAFGFTGGVSARFDNLGTNAANATVASGTLAQKNRTDLHAGIAYGQGPWSIGTSVAYFRASRVDGAGVTRDHDSVTAEALGANYALGPGININAAVEHIDNSVGTVAALGGVNQIGASEHAWIYTIGTVFNF
jgi:hypothetical protein